MSVENPALPTPQELLGDSSQQLELHELANGEFAFSAIDALRLARSINSVVGLGYFSFGDSARVVNVPWNDEAVVSGDIDNEIRDQIRDASGQMDLMKKKKGYETEDDFKYDFWLAVHTDNWEIWHKFYEDTYGLTRPETVNQLEDLTLDFGNDKEWAKDYIAFMDEGAEPEIESDEDEFLRLYALYIGQHVFAQAERLIARLRGSMIIGLMFESDDEKADTTAEIANSLLDYAEMKGIATDDTRSGGIAVVRI